MGEQLVLVAVIVTLVGALLAFITSRIARKSLSLALIMSPFTVVLSIAIGLVIGLELMLIEGAELACLILLITAPIALTVGIVVTLRTQTIITETHKKLAAAQREREVEQGKRELITWLSHDLRTPLAGMRAMAEALDDGVVPNPHQYYQQIIIESQRTSAMVEEMMSLASLQTHTLSLSKEPINLQDLISDSVSQLSELATTQQMRFAASICSEPLTCEGDAALLTRALQNVLANAIYYSMPNSTLQVRLDRVNTMAHLAITDRCGGISDDTRQHMFDVGWRASQARTPHQHSGSGLGLSIVKTIVEAHGGCIYVEPLVGCCCVHIELPLSIPQHSR